MDQKDTFKNLLLSLAVFLVILWVIPRLLPTPPSRTPVPASDQGETPAGESAGRTGTDRESPGEGGAPSRLPSGEASAPAPSGGQSGGFEILEADGEQTVAIGSAPTNGIDTTAIPSPYRMRLTLSNIGASVESATMTDHAETLGSEERYRLLTPIERDDGRRFRSLAVEQINIDGTVLSLADRKWHMDPVEEAEEGQTLRCRLDIHKEGVPALRLTRTFTLPRQEKKLLRHDVQSEIKVENLSDQPRRVILTYGGGLGIRQVNPRMDDRYVDWGLSDGTRVSGHRKPYADIAKQPGHTSRIYEPSAAQPQTRLSWAATANTYFTCTMAPLNGDGTDNASYLADVKAMDADGDALTADDTTLQFITRAETVDPNRTVTYPADVYLGQKDGGTFREITEYLARNYYFQIAQGFGWCTFPWLVELMIWLLNTLFVGVRDYGVAIIILVLVVRALLHPITKKGQVNMVRMQQRMGDFAPKVEELKKKYGNDKARLQQETMKLYREHGINPGSQLLTCLPMVIQMPIWVALFFSLSNNIRMRHQPFHGTWIHDLTAPDALYTFSSPFHIPLFGWEVQAFNLLPILLAIFMYLQQKLQPKPKPNPNATDQQRQQQEMMQKMMPIMSIMMLFLFYPAPSGLTLYIMSSSFFGMIEQHLIRKHIKHHEAAGTFHRTPPTPKPEPPPRKHSDKLSIIEKLQKMAEDARKAQPKRPSKNKARR